MLKRNSIFIALLLSVIGILAFIKFQQIQGAMEMMAANVPPPTAVEVREARRVQWQPRVAAVGTLTAHQGIDLSNEVEGVIEAIHVESGERVKKGDLLLTLNDDVEQADLASYQALEELAQVVYKRNRNMWKKKTISETDYDNARSALKVAQANVMQTKARIAKKSIRAPFSGVLGIRHVSIGQFVPTGTMLVSLQDQSTLYADFAIPEKYLPLTRAGLEVQLHVSAYSDRYFSGKVQAIDSKVDETTRNINVRSRLDNSEGLLHPGMYADIALMLDQPAERIIVPATAIIFSSFGNALFIVSENKDGVPVAKRVQVTTGEQRGDMVAILTGLQGGEKVIQAGVNKLQNNIPVAISETVGLKAN